MTGADDWIVRDALPGDVETIVSFNVAMASETEGKELPLETLRRGVRSLFEDRSRGFYLVAESDGAVVGALMLTREWSDWRNGEFWWVQSVYVERLFRRRGIYRLLYSEVRRRARMNPRVCGCRLYVERGNAVARKAYESLGMKETSYRMYEEVFPGSNG